LCRLLGLSVSNEEFIKKYYKKKAVASGSKWGYIVTSSLKICLGWNWQEQNSGCIICPVVESVRIPLYSSDVIPSLSEVGAIHPTK